MNWVKEAFKKVPTKPVGWVTVAEVVDQSGQKPSTVQRRLAMMVANGDLEVQVFRVGTHNTKCYRPTQKKGRK